MAVVIAESAAFVKKSYKNGKVPSSYEGVPLTYNVNAFTTLDDAINEIQLSGGLDNIVLLDSSITLKTAIADMDISIASLYLEDDEEKYKAKGTFKTSADMLNDLKYFKTVNVNGASVKNITGGNVDIASNGVKLIDSLGTVKVNSGSVLGDIAYYKSVSLVNSNVDGTITSGDIMTATIAYATGNTFTSTGSLTIIADKNAADAVYTIGSASAADEVIYGFKSINVSGFEKGNILSAVVINGNITGGVVSHQNAGIVELKVSMATGSMKLTKEVTVNGSIQGLKTVTLKDDITIDGDVLGGTSTGMMMGAEKSDGKLTANDNIFISGTIYGYKTVTLTDAAVTGGVEGYSTKGTTLNMTESLVGDVSGMQKVNIKKGANSLASFTGTAENDTFTISKNASVAVSGKLDFGFGTKDKLALNGTLVLNTVDVQGLESMTGSGEIACTDDIFTAATNAFANLGKNKVKFINLGQTSENFVSTKYENSDDTAKNAVAWEDTESVFKGWLANDASFDCVDSVDFIEFEVYSGTLKISGEGLTVFLDGRLQSDLNAINFSGSNEHILEIRRNSGEGAIAYSVEMC